MYTRLGMADVLATKIQVLNSNFDLKARGYQHEMFLIPRPLMRKKNLIAACFAKVRKNWK